MKFKKNKCLDEDVKNACHFISRVDDCVDFLENLYNETYNSYMYTNHDDLRIQLAKIKFINNILTTFCDDVREYVNEVGGDCLDFYEFNW